MEDDTFVINLCAVCFCMACSAVGAGLTMGLMSVEKTRLEISLMTGTEQEANAAKAIKPIVNDHHRLLVTLLLFNAVANEAMPVFLEKIVPPYVAVLLSVSLVLIFGEILPSALFTGPNQIVLAAKLSSFVWFLMYLLYPISYPIGKILDFVFGHEEEGSMSRSELEALVILQNTAMKEKYNNCGRNDSGFDGDAKNELTEDEIEIMTGVLRLSYMSAQNAMIPINNVSMISSDVLLDEITLEKIMKVGYSRYPVFEKGNREFILGYILVKNLIIVNPSEKKPVSSLKLFEPIVVHPEEDLLKLLNIFQEGKSHIAFVSYDPEETLQCIQENKAPCSMKAKSIGIVTLENVIEKIIQEEIYDEADHLRSHNARSILKSADGKSGDAMKKIQVDGKQKKGMEAVPLLSGYSCSNASRLPSRKQKPSLSVRPIQEASMDIMQGKRPARIQRYSTFDSLRMLKNYAPVSAGDIVLDS